MLGESELVEREDSLQKLRSLADQARLGRGAVALVGGEAGIGKTTLLNSFHESRRDTYRVIRGGCDPLFTPRTFGPIHDMGHAFGEEVSRLLKSNSQPAALFSAILASLDGARTPTILICEDVHWADHATLDLIKFLGRRIQFLNTLLVLSFRSDEVGPAHPLTRVLGEIPSAPTRRIELKRLSKEGVQILAAQSGYNPDDLHKITAGNPFFVSELIAAGGANSNKIPASIKDAVASRLSHVEADERAFLSKMSLIPGAVPTVLRDGFFTNSERAAVQTCMDKGILVEDEVGSLRFRHELARLATQSRMSPQQQKQGHAEILAFLLGQDNSIELDQIVHHAASALDGPCVIEYAPKAAKAAAQAGAHRESALHYATALKFVEHASPEIAAQLYEDWAYEAGLALHIDDSVLEARRHAVTLWTALGRKEKVAENLRWLSRSHWYRGEAIEADRYSDQAIKVLEDMPPSIERAMAYSLRSQLCMLNDKMEEAIIWGERALELEKQFENLDVRIHALNNIGTSMVFRDNKEGLKHLQESLDLALANGFHEHAARVYTNLGEYGVVFRDFELAERILTEGVAYDIEHDLDSWTHYLQGRLALLRMKQGRFRDAEAIANGIVNIERLTLLMRLPALQVLAKTKMRLGDPKAGQMVQQSLKDAVAVDELQHIVPARLTLVESAWLDDDVDGAREHLDYLLSLENSDRHPWDLGEVVIWGHRYQRNVHYEDQLKMPKPYQLELDGDPIAAADEWERLQSPYSAALALMQAKTDKESAYKRALKLLSKMEAGGAINKLSKMAEEAGLTLKVPKPRRGPYKAARNHPLGLTAREQEILRLMVNGATNREISETLSRSQRTIEHHVSSTLAKLNAKNRMAAMLRIQDEPWLLPNQKE